MQQSIKPGAGAPEGRASSDEPFLSDVETLRRRARQHMESGAVTQNYGLPAETVVNVLNAALATEIVCTLRYKHHYFVAKGIDAETARAEFLEHANQEQQHADRIAERIIQLGGDPDLSPEGLASRSHSQYDRSTDLRTMIEEDLVAERIAIESYREIAQWLGDRDSTSRKMMEEILATEEEHADDLVSLLEGMDELDQRPRARQGQGSLAGST